jgi:hypothetical protein
MSLYTQEIAWIWPRAAASPYGLHAATGETRLSFKAATRLCEIARLEFGAMVRFIRTFGAPAAATASRAPADAGRIADLRHIMRRGDRARMRPRNRQFCLHQECGRTAGVDHPFFVRSIACRADQRRDPSPIFTSALRDRPSPCSCPADRARQTSATRHQTGGCGTRGVLRRSCRRRSDGPRLSAFRSACGTLRGPPTWHARSYLIWINAR